MAYERGATAGIGGGGPLVAEAGPPMRPPRHIPSLRPLLASVALLAACTEAPPGGDGLSLALVQVKLPDDPNRLLSIDLPRVPIATGGRGGYGLVRGDLDGAARLIVVDEVAPAVAATLRGDELTTIGIADGASEFIIAVDDATVALTEVAATPTAAIARPDLGAAWLDRADWADRGAAARFTAAAEVPIAIGLLAASGQRLIDLDVAATPGPGWRTDGARLTLLAPPVGQTLVSVTSGAVTLALPVEVVAAADDIRASNVACEGGGVFRVCAAATAGGHDVIAYDWALTPRAPASVASAQLPINCVAVTAPPGTAAVTLDVHGGNRDQLITLAPPC